MNFAVDLGPMARLESVKADPAAPSVIFQKLTDTDAPATLQQIAREWALPKGRFVEWFTVEHANLYDTALKVLADSLAHDALAKADACKDKDDAPAAKLQVDTRLKLASKWDRPRYGEKQDLNVNVTQWVLRLPTPSASTGEWLKTINSAPTPALAAPEVAPEPLETVPDGASI